MEQPKTEYKNDDKPFNVNGATWLALKWTHPEKNAPLGLRLDSAVVPRVFKAANGVNLVKLARTDINPGSTALPLVFPTETRFRVAFFDGDKDSPFNPSNMDQAMTLTLAIDLPAYCEKLAEMQDAFVLAALATRDQWAPKHWEKLASFSAASVEQTVRRKFGWSPPRPKEKRESDMAAYDDEKCSPRPRAAKPHEYPGMLAMKVLGKYLKMPDPQLGEDECELLPNCFLDLATIGLPEAEQKWLGRTDINYTSRGFFKFGCLGVCPSAEANMTHMWRVFSGVVSKATATAPNALTVDLVSQMRETTEREDVSAVFGEGGAPAGEPEQPPAEKRPRLDGGHLVEVMELIKADTTKDGASTAQMAAKLKIPLTNVRLLVDELVAGFQVYNTVDMDHYKAVE